MNAQITQSIGYMFLWNVLYVNGAKLINKTLEDTLPQI